MLKYISAAATFKFFSLTAQTKWAYRKLGNLIGQHRKIKNGLEEWRMINARDMLSEIERYQLIRDGDKVLELGTGWVHWGSTVIRLFYDVEITLFDVWDNRQLLAYKSFFQEFGERMERSLNLTPERRQRAERVLKVISDANSFEEIYKTLNFNYVINPKGSLKQFPDNYFSCIFSVTVFEHVYQKIVPELIQELARIIKPGGYSIQVIDMGDHLTYYDLSMFRKFYLTVPKALWRWLFENDVQYFNRIQRSQWLEYFRSNNFVLVDELDDMIDLSAVQVHRDYAHLSPEDLRCLNMIVVHQNKERSGNPLHQEQAEKLHVLSGAGVAPDS